MSLGFQHLVFPWLVAFVLSAAAVLAQPLASSDYTLREWRTDAGLPSEAVTQVVQDRKGFLWVATRGGLTRFDGSHFVEVPLNEDRTYISTMLEAADGSLLLTPRAGHPVRVRERVITVEPLPHPHSGKTVGALAQAPDGSIWYSIPGFVLRILGGEVESFDGSHGIDGKSWASFATDGEKRFWIASGPLLARYEHGKLVRVPLETSGAELRITSSRENGPWVVGADRVWKMGANDEAAIVTRIPPLLGAHYLNTTCETGDGVLWLGTRSQGVYRLSRDGPQQIPTTHEDVSAMIEDTEGNLWVGTTSGGLKALAPKIYRLYNKSSGLLSNSTTAVCEDQAGNLWIANGDGGVARLRDSIIECRPTAVGGRLFGTVSVAAAADGGIWLAGQPGLFRAPGGPDRIELFNTEIVTGIRRVLFSAKNGDLWLSVDPDGVGRLRAGQLVIFRSAEGFEGREVRTFAEDNRGVIWTGSSDGRVFRFADERFHAVNIPLKESPGGINSILFTEAGNMWLGTARSGLVVISGATATSLGKREGLPDYSVTHLLSDGYGGVWCGSGIGIFRLKKGEVEDFLRKPGLGVTPLILGKDEGVSPMVSVGIYGPAAIRSRSGMLWFATREGVLAINPKARALAPSVPRVSIEDVRCDGKSSPISHPFTLTAGTRKLEVQFSVLCLSAPNRAKAWYRIDGFDTDWNEVPSTQTAVYPRLPPGKYRIEVRGGFGDVRAAQSEDSLVMLVMPHWWQQLWVQVIGVLIFSAGIAGVVRAWSHRRLKLRLEKLEREASVVSERARIAQNIHDDVGASLTRISLLTQAAAKDPQRQASNMNRIYETTREITRSLDEIVWAINPRYDTIESFVGYLTGHAQSYLSAADIRCRIFCTSELTEIPLNTETRHQLFLCCKEALHNVVKHAGASEVVITLRKDAQTLTMTIADNGRGGHPGHPAVDRVQSGNGLRNMRERMVAIGGMCRTEAGSGGGMVVTFILGLKQISP